MKQIHTQAKKARRSSWFSKPHGKSVSEMRLLKREDLQPRKPKTFGQQIHHVQHIQLLADLPRRDYQDHFSRTRILAP